MKRVPVMVFEIALIFCLSILPIGWNYQTARAQSLYGLYFSSGKYVRAASGLSLGLQTFTVETWFYKQGNGVPSSSGYGGIEDGIPLVSKGSGESDSSTKDCNYYLAISQSKNTLVADFEDMEHGGNHPIFGITPIQNNVWYHAAATYDGATWRLYLDGELEAEFYIGSPNTPRATPRWDSIQYFGFGSSFGSAGNPWGYFNGILDEVRVWNHARSQSEIRSTMDREIDPTNGLAGYWRLNEGTGTVAQDFSGNGNDCVVSGATWTAQTTRMMKMPPKPPVISLPGDGTQVVQTNPTLSVTVNDPDSNSLEVTFWGRTLTVPHEDFTIVALPDTQIYSKSYPQVFNGQTQWIVDNQASRNIAFVTHEGDVVDDGKILSQWSNAATAMALLDGKVPYAFGVGNHDMFGGTINFNSTFPYTRYVEQAWYGGHYGLNNDNSFQLFSAGGLDWIIVHLQYSPDAGMLSWADDLLESHSDRRAIVTSHDILLSNNNFSTSGQAIYDALKINENLFLMLCGHAYFGSRTDTFNGNTVYTVMSDYQDDCPVGNGGEGWLRIMKFEPDSNQISVQTYSPFLHQNLIDSRNQFAIPYNMYPSVPFNNLGTVSGVSNGGVASFQLPNTLGLGVRYEWYVTVSDGTTTMTGPKWSFSTASSKTMTSIAISPANSSISVGQTKAFSAIATYSDLTTTDITATATWSSSNTDIATMNGNVATGKSQGQTNITAAQSGITSNNAVLTVTATITSIAISPANSSILVGQTKAFSAIATYSDLTTADITATATWSSSATSIATMIGSFATGKSQGQTNVTATQNGVTSNNAALIVNPATITSIAISPANSSISVGQTKAFSAIATYSDLTTTDITATATWSSSNTNIATMNGNVATGKSQGQTNITAAQGGFVSNVAVLAVISQKTSTSMSVSSATGVYGGSIGLSAKLTKTVDGSVISGKTIVFTGNGTIVGSATTDTRGLATLKNVSLIGVNAGVYPNTIGASFAGDNGFASSSGRAQLIVSKATPTITWSNPANVPYGTPLSATQLNAVASAKGTLIYNPSAGTVLPTGNGQSLRVDFTPTDTVNYKTASKTVSINVIATTTISLTITSPASGSVLTVGSTITISWTSTGDPGYLNLILSRDGGVTWAPIKYYTPKDGKETWTVTGPVTSNGRIGIFSVNNSNIYSIVKVIIR